MSKSTVAPWRSKRRPAIRSRAFVITGSESPSPRIATNSVPAGRMMLGWSLTSSILLSAGVVLIYVFFGGLSSSIYNEVIQFFLIWLGLLPVVYVGLKAVGGFSGLAAKLPDTFLHAWKNMGSAAANPMGVDWMGSVLGLGFVLSLVTGQRIFLVVQRTLASENISAARRTPIMAAFPKCWFR